MKKGNRCIIFPLDVDSAAEAEDLVRLLDQKVGMFKIGLELFIDQGPAMVKRVRALSNAGIFLDLKLHDICATVKKAMESAVRTGADLVTVHASSSQKMLEMAVLGGQGKTRVLGVTLLTDNDASVVEACGFRQEYVNRTEQLVLKRAGFAHGAGCAGVVCSGLEAAAVKKAFGRNFLAVTPGIRPAWGAVENDDQKRITTPAMAMEQGADFIVVGRPIRTAADPCAAADAVAGEVEEALSARYAWAGLSRPNAV